MPKQSQHSQIRIDGYVMTLPQGLYFSMHTHAELKDFGGFQTLSDTEVDSVLADVINGTLTISDFYCSMIDLEKNRDLHSLPKFFASCGLDIVGSRLQKLAPGTTIGNAKEPEIKGEIYANSLDHWNSLQTEGVEIADGVILFGKNDHREHTFRANTQSWELTCS